MAVYTFFLLRCLLLTFIGLIIYYLCQPVVLCTVYFEIDEWIWIRVYKHKYELLQLKYNVTRYTRNTTYTTTTYMHTACCVLNIYKCTRRSVKLTDDAEGFPILLYLIDSLELALLSCKWQNALRNKKIQFKKNIFCN